jgi:hypothetical protein
MRKPYWRKRIELDIREAGISEEKLNAVKAKYKEAGLDLNRIPRRGWRVFGVQKPEHTHTEATIFLKWDSLLSLVLLADDLIKQYEGK